MNDLQVLMGDCRDTLKTLPDECVQTVVTSPPYFGLRDYGTAQWEGGDADCAHVQPFVPRHERLNVSGAGIGKGGAYNNAQDMGRSAFRTLCGLCGASRIDRQIGLEETPLEYVTSIVNVFEEVWRVLRGDGTVWLNLGDSYANDGKWGGHTGGKHAAALHCSPIGRNKKYTGLKPKDLIGIPWRVAFALQEAGWWLRSDIVWAKPNAMPESVTDRPTRSHEYIFLLTKSEQYYYDADAIAEPAGPFKPAGPASRMDNDCDPAHGTRKQDSVGSRLYTGFNDRWKERPTTTRNKRDVWTVGTQAYPDAHYAVFPEKLIEPCVLAGTSERGCCPACRAPWERIVERERLAPAPPSGNREIGRWDVRDTSSVGGRPATHGTGWRPTCACDAGDAIPCTVLDPFGGSGTTAKVAIKHRRRAIICELNPEYARLIDKRTNGVQVTLPWEMESVV